MTTSRLRLALSALAIAGATLLVAGCTASPASPAPTSSENTGDASAPTPGDDMTADDVELAWLDGGRGFAVVTWGSSSCVPVVDAVGADGQNVTVTLANGDEKACTDDLVPRALFVAIPEGVDVTKDVEVTVEYGGRTDDADLDALAEAPDGTGEQTPSAGWFEDDGIALLTWGSSTCQPVVNDIEQSDAGATVTFDTIDRVCTMDYVPRVTTIMLPTEHDDDDGPFELTLVGDHLDGTVQVMG